MRPDPAHARSTAARAKYRLFFIVEFANIPETLIIGTVENFGSPDALNPDYS
jgi:hypothetical protein